MNKRTTYIVVGLCLVLVGSIFAWNLSSGKDLTLQTIDQEAYLEQNLEAWGLGKVLTSYVNNDRYYEWYVDQGDTGRHAQNNCGPASIAMVGLWADHNFSKSTQAIRRAFRPLGGWWYADDINGALTKYKISHEVVGVEDHSALVNIIDSGYIAIINNNMGKIPFNSNAQQRTQRFYRYSSGHYFVLKGYAVVDGKVYFEVYDSNSGGEVYADGTPKGKNRYYSAEVMLNSVVSWWPEVVVIYPKYNLID